MEHIIVSNIWKHLHKHDIILHFQHGFQSGLSCESQLIETVHDWMTALDNKTQIDAILLDFAKAFDKVPHKRLLSKLTSHGITGNTQWRSQGGPGGPCPPPKLLLNVFFLQLISGNLEVIRKCKKKFPEFRSFDLDLLLPKKQKSSHYPLPPRNVAGLWLWAKRKNFCYYPPPPH